MDKTFILLKRETSESAKTASIRPVAFDGFLLRVTVEKVANITDKIFVMQRDVASNYSDGVEDTYHGLASVGEIAWIPENTPNGDSNFFRTNTVELMFEDKEEMEDAWRKFVYDAKALSEANDRSYNIAEETWHPFPSDALPSYYGVSASEIDPDNLVDQLTELGEYTKNIGFQAVFEEDSYLYFVVYHRIGESLVVQYGETVIPMTITPVDIPNEITNDDEPYLIYRSTNKLVGPFNGFVTLSER